MEYPTWLLWTVAMLLAMMPMSVLLMARSAKPEERCANPLEETSEDVASGILVISEEEALVLARAIAYVQMRQRWGKDIDWID